MSERTDGDSRRGFGPDFLTDLFHHPLDPGYADAAARRAKVGPRTGWRRRTSRTITVVTLSTIGFLLVVAYRQTLADEPVRTQARAGLVEQVQRRQAETDRLQQRAERLRVEVAQLRDAALSGPDAARLRDLEAATGLAGVRGDGVVVRLADGPAPVDAVTGKAGKPDQGRVLDGDLQDVANALWAAGAEAVAVNGQRLTATSTIRAAGGAILVDFRPVTSPYEVTAIGADDLERRFRDSPTARLLRRLVSDYGMTVEVRRADDLTLPGASQLKLRFASTPPAPGSTPSAPSTPGPSGPTSSAGPDGPVSAGPAPTSAGPSSSPSEGGR
jgi:uncharacterized protein YlxW (UPF0749 family)